MKKMLTVKEYKRMVEEYDKVKYKCKCGHGVIIPNRLDKILCNWCGNYVFKNKEDEFKYRIQESLMNNTERLDNAKENIGEEVARSNAISQIANTYIKSCNLVIRANETKVSITGKIKDVTENEK